jgi:hypothetical protein
MEILAEIAETPKSLWLNGHHSSGGHNDRVPEAIARSSLRNSLYMIRPRFLTLSRSIEHDNPKVRAGFGYAKDGYRLVVTDLEVEAAMARLGLGAWRLDPTTIFLTISLALPFNGYAYKLVAGIIGFDPTCLVKAPSSSP